LILGMEASCQAFDFNAAVGIMISRSGRLTVRWQAVARSLKLGIAAVAVGVTARLLVQIPRQSFGQVDSRLVGQAEGDEQDIGQFIGQLARRFSRLARLVAVRARENPRDFTDLLDELGQVGQLVKVPDTDAADPLVDELLCAANRDRLFVLLTFMVSRWAVRNDCTSTVYLPAGRSDTVAAGWGSS
jgi:hypothetical protein